MSRMGAGVWEAGPRRLAVASERREIHRFADSALNDGVG